MYSNYDMYDPYYEFTEQIIPVDTPVVNSK